MAMQASDRRCGSWAPLEWPSRGLVEEAAVREVYQEPLVDEKVRAQDWPPDIRDPEALDNLVSRCE